MTKTHDYWFRAKRYGYGWSWPINWQGWLTLGVSLLVFLLSLLLLELPDMAEDRPVSRSKLVAHILMTIVNVLVLFLIGKRYGEPARWRWGGKDKDAADRR